MKTNISKICKAVKCAHFEFDNSDCYIENGEVKCWVACGHDYKGIRECCIICGRDTCKENENQFSYFVQKMKFKKLIDKIETQTTL